MGDKPFPQLMATSIEALVRLCRTIWYYTLSTQLRHDERDGVSNHRRLCRLLSRLFRRRSKKISKLRVTGLCAWNSPLTGELPAQVASNAENESI